jgi:RNA polymerase sigma-70 factor (ECF subfamily)
MTFDPNHIERAIQDYQAGKAREENFDRLDEYYRPRLLRIFARRGFSPEISEELTQTVAVRVFQELDKLRSPSFGVFAALINKSANSVRCDFLREQHAQKRAAVTISLDDSAEGRDLLPLDIVDDAPRANPLQVVMSKEKQEQIKAAIARLPRQQRRCVEFRLYQGLSYAEIATAMNISVEAVKSHLKEGMKKLRELLREEGDAA